PLCGLANGGSVILAGDPLQLPPIQPAEPPKGLENLVGSSYAFFQCIHGVPQSSLAVNYRSNEALVAFAHMSGYESTLQSYSPDVRTDLPSPLPTTQPADWPPGIIWSPEWSALLDPIQPAVSFVYDDGRSSQRNEFEAEAVASLLVLLSGRMANQLLNENHP